MRSCFDETSMSMEYSHSLPLLQPPTQTVLLWWDLYVYRVYAQPTSHHPVALLPWSPRTPVLESTQQSQHQLFSFYRRRSEKARGLFKSEQQLHARVGTGIQISLFLSPCPPSSLNHSNLISPGSRGRGHCHEEWHHSSFGPSLFMSWACGVYPLKMGRGINFHILFT